MVSESQVYALNKNESQKIQTIIEQIIENKEFQVLKNVLKEFATDKSKQDLGVQFFYEIEDQYINVDAEVMEDIASTLLDIFTKNQNPAFNRAEYKIRFQLADIYINVKGEFDQGIKYLIDADQQSDRLGQNMEESEKKELTYEVIANITNQYFENGKSEYVREWIKKMNNIGNYINEFEQSLTTTELKKKYEKRLNSLKQQRNNYFWLKANEEDSKKNFLRAAKLYLAFIKELNPNDENIQSNLIQALDQAIICAVLGESGPLRANIVAQIFQDKNIEKSNHRDLLYKTHQNKLITETDKQRLVEQLKSHQKATDNTYQLSQEFTIYEKAITEHNILACTELYESISMKSLSQKLLINEQDTELILQTMINKGSLKASIDQTTSFITFLQSEQMPIDFNERISNFAGKVNDYLEKIAKN